MCQRCRCCVKGVLVGDRAAVPEAGVAADGVVAVQPVEEFEAGFAFAGPAFRPWSVSRFIVALKLSAAALSALEPTALIDWTTPARRQASAKVRLVYCDP